MLTDSYSAGICANTYERQRLGWISPQTAFEDASLSDFITTGVAFKFHPSGGATNEYYYFENHQKLSIYDDATVNGGDKGIWVLHQRDVYNSTNNIRAKPQDGYWNWQNPSYNTTCFPGFTVAALKKLSVNRNFTGYSNRDKIPISPSGYSWLLTYIDQNNNEICGGYYGGAAPFYGAFNSTKNNVFSTWSNPTANTWNDDAVDFAMHVMSQDGNTLNVWFYTYGDAIYAPPAKPQNLRITNTTYTPMNLAWAANIEPDFSTYEVWRQVLSWPGTWEMIATTTSTSYTDYEYTWAPGAGDFVVSYSIRAKDAQSYYSSFSDIASNQAEYNGKAFSSGEELRLSENQALEYDLFANYPNPFNPETRISFALPEPSLVRITIFDVLGREIRTLVSREYPAGYHTTNWNASDGSGKKVTSGVYFYRMSATAISGKQFTKVLKMAAVK